MSRAEIGMSEKQDEDGDDFKPYPIWTIPGSRTKNKRTHEVPLSPLVYELITSALNDGNWVFTTNGDAPVNVGSKIKSRLDEVMALHEPWRLHDLRHTVVSGMANIGVPPHIAEAVVNHVSGAKAGMAGHYNHYEYRKEKKIALERWAAHIDGLVNGRSSNVVAIRKAGVDDAAA